MNQIITSKNLDLMEVFNSENKFSPISGNTFFSQKYQKPESVKDFNLRLKISQKSPVNLIKNL